MAEEVVDVPATEIDKAQMPRLVSRLRRTSRT